MNLLTTIPFDGFYQSRHSDCLDSLLEQELDAHPSHSIDDYDFDLRGYARAYLDAYRNSLEFPIDLKFKALVRPKFYNYETDIILAEVPLKDVEELRLYLGNRDIRSYLKDVFTDRSGFISFYSNDLNDWDKEPMSEWDYNQIGALFETLMQDNDSIEVPNPEEYVIYTKNINK